VCRRSPFEMKFILQIASVALIWTMVLAFAVPQGLSDGEPPIWATDVLPPLSRGQMSVTRPPDARRAGVVFSDDTHLVVYEVGHDGGQPSAQTGAEVLRPFVLRLLLLDSTSGRVTLAKEERTRVQDATVLATSSGLLVKTGGVIKLFSPDLAQKRDVPFAVDRDSGVRMSVSPTGKTIMLNEVIQDSLNLFHSHLNVIDAATGKVRYSWNESPPLYHHYSISDEGIAALTLVGDFIAVSGFGTGKWARVGESAGLCATGNMPTLYSDQLFVYGCDKLIAMSINGDVLMADPFPKGDSPSVKATVSQEGRLVAISLNTVEIKKHFLAESNERVTATHAVVYDVALKRRILAMNVEPLPKNDYDFALSPDGSKLAILNDRKVSVYSVPGQPVWGRR